MKMAEVTTYRVVSMLIVYEYGGGNDPPCSEMLIIYEYGGGNDPPCSENVDRI